MKNDKQPPKVVAYTDGAFTKWGGGIAGWGAYITFDGRHKTIGGYLFDATSSVAELAGVINVLRTVKRTKHPLIIRTDSKYVVSCANRGEKWRSAGWVTSTGKPAANIEHVKELLSLLRKHREIRCVRILWVKGHDGEVGNEVADFVATQNKEIGYIISSAESHDESEEFSPRALVKKFKT